MDTVKIIFLDIDGVICLYPQWQTGWIGNENDRLDSVCCRNLKEILTQTGARIILSSSWRLCPENLKNLTAQLKSFGIEPSLIIGHTSGLQNSLAVQSHNELRWAEIHDCVTRFGFDNYIVLDDFDLERWAGSRLIRTKRHTGLTAQHRDVAIRKLNEENGR